MLCFLTVKKRLERRSVIYCYHGSKMSRCQKSFWDGRKVRARNALAIRKGRDWANTIYFNFTQVVGSYANFLQQMKAFTREKSSISTGVFRLATESNRSRSRKRSRKSAYDLVKIKDECRKRSDNRNGIGLSEESERFHFFRHPLRLNRLRFACDLVKTRLPESEAETEVACSRLSDSGEDAKEKRTRKVGGAGKRKKERRERELVIISFTTLFRPLLARSRWLDFGCQTVEMWMSWNLSQISREIISRYFIIIPHASVCNLECKKLVGRQHKTFSSCQNAACSTNIFSHSTGRLCSGGVYILTEQTMWFWLLVSCWEVVTRILLVLKFSISRHSNY